MIKTLIYFITIIFLTIIFVAIFPSTYNNLSYFYPSFFLFNLPVLYYLIKNKQKYFVLVTIISFIYNLLFSEIFLIPFLAMVICIIIAIIYLKSFSYSFIKSYFLVMLLIIIYDSFIFLSLAMLFNKNLVFSDLIYKLSHSLIYPFVMAIISYIFLKSRKVSDKISFSKYY